MLAVRKKLLEARNKEHKPGLPPPESKHSLKSFGSVVHAAQREEKEEKEEDRTDVEIKHELDRMSGTQSPPLPPRPSSSVIEAHEEMFQAERKKARREIAKKRMEQKLVCQKGVKNSVDLSPREENAFRSCEEDSRGSEDGQYSSEGEELDCPSAHSGFSNRSTGHLDNIYEEASFSSMGSGHNLSKHDTFSEENESTLLQRFADWQENTVPRALCASESIAEMHKLVTCPVPEGEVIKCQIERIGNGESKDYYSLTIPITQKDTPRERRLAVMLAQKKKTIARMGSSKYVLSLEHEDMYRPRSKRSNWYFGKLKTIPLRSTLFTSSKLQYVLTYDALDQQEQDIPPLDPRHQAASIVYTREVSMTRTRSHMTVALASPGGIEKEEKKEGAAEGADLCDEHLGNVYGFEGFYFDSATPEGTTSKVKYMEKIENASKRPSFAHLIRFPIAPSVKNYELKPLDVHKSRRRRDPV